MTKPAEYSPEIAEQILNRILDGEMLTKICKEDGMPDRLAFYRWMAARPELANAYARVRLAWADYWAEKGLMLSLDGSGDIFLDESGKAVTDHANIQRARLQVDTIKWLVGKYAPRVYGDKPADTPSAPDGGENSPQKITRIERVIVSELSRARALELAQLEQS